MDDSVDTSSWDGAVVSLSASGTLTSTGSDVTAQRLCSHFCFVATYRSLSKLRAAMPHRDERCFIVRPLSLSHLLTSFSHFTAKDYVGILRSLNIHAGDYTKKHVALSRLENINPSPTDLIDVFKTIVRACRPTAGPRQDPRAADRDRKRKARDEETSDEALKRRELDASAHAEQSANEVFRHRLQAMEDVRHIESSFPEIASDELKYRIISDFQSYVHPAKWKSTACAVCRSVCYGDSARVVDSKAFDLSLLRNPASFEVAAEGGYQVHLHLERVTLLIAAGNVETSRAPTAPPVNGTTDMVLLTTGAGSDSGGRQVTAGMETDC